MITDFAKLLQALAGCQVEFILIGGVAATVHGSARLTQDIDVVYARHADNLARIVESLTPLDPYLRGAPPGLPFVFDQQTLAQGLNFTLISKSGAIDLLGEIPGGGTYEDLLPHTLPIQAFGVELKCLDLPMLIHVKRAAGRPKDLEIIAELVQLLDEQDNASGEA